MAVRTRNAGSERYLATSRLGEGGMAEVYRAWDRHHEAWRAIKVLREKYATKESARARFIDEGRTVMDLAEHRNVIEALDLVDRPEQPFLVMEIAEGGSLKEWVDRHGHMSPRLAVDVAVQISKGIGAAHRIGVVHRDVKPHNILLSRRGQCKVIDFGIAQILRADGTTDIPDARSLTTQNAMGTLGYMAPEQRTDPRSADVRTDVYGIGATLYTLLTGRVVTNLFIADRDPELLEGIPEELIPVLKRATAYKPDQRYGSVQELARALFDVGAILPDDPPDRPGLAPQLPPEPPPPPAGEAPTPISVPRHPPRPGPPRSAPRSVTGGPPPLRPPPVPPGLPSTLPPTTRTPSPARRRAGRHDDDITEDLSRGRPRTRPLIVLGTLSLMAITLLLWDMIRVNGAQERAFETGQAFRQTVTDHSGIIDVLQLAKVDVGPLEAQYDALLSAPGPRSTALAGQTYLGALQRAAVQVHDPAELRRIHSRFQPLAERHEALRLSVETWEGKTFPGVAIGLGLARGPF